MPDLPTIRESDVSAEWSSLEGGLRGARFVVAGPAAVGEGLSIVSRHRTQHAAEKECFAYNWGCPAGKWKYRVYRVVRDAEGASNG